MKGKLLLIIAFFISTLFICSCSKDDQIPADGSVEITEFNVFSGDTKVVGAVDNEKKEVVLNIPAGIDVKALRVDAKFTDGATLSPESGYIYNFTQPINFVLSKDEKSVTYKVVAGATPLILSASLPSYYKDVLVDDSKIIVEASYGVDLTKMKISYDIPAGCTASPVSGTIFDLTKDSRIEITNAANTKKIYDIEVVKQEQETAVRAVWLPDPSHTTVMHSYKNLNDFVNLVDNLNLNTIYLATWVRSMTIFKSQVLKANTNYSTVEDGYLFGNMAYDGPSGDPVRDLITLAHAKNIKVIFWFEYGFMRDGGAKPSASHPILSVHPEWDGLGNDGKPSNYNGTDYYLNSYDPEVQEFMIKLVEESIDLYPDVDGIQGDDRMPAAPRNSGYNQSTREKYFAAKGVYPPADYNNAEWVRWRLDLLNAFGKQMFDRIKAKRSSLIVCFSPNPYPWCEDNLMQDWPGWIKSGIVQLLSVQCYRNDLASYQYTISTTNDYIKKSTGANIFNPGIYLRNTTEWETLFVEQMKANRKLGTNGEAFFYNEGLKQEINQRVIKAFYTGKAIFPKL